MPKTITEYINDNLNGKAKQTALEFVAFLQSKHLTFYKDTCECWKDKIYYWVKLDEECVCFIAINDPDEPQNLWTVWSDESKLYEDYVVDEKIKETALRHIDHCGNCGSCRGGRSKKVFGKMFNRVCGCTFRVDNPTPTDLPFLEKMVEIKMIDICKKVKNYYEHY